MVATMYADEGDLMRIQLLEFFAVRNRDQQVLCSVNNIGVAFYFFYPFVGA